MILTSAIMRKSNKRWYVEVNGKQVNLGANRTRRVDRTVIDRSESDLLFSKPFNEIDKVSH